MASSCLCSHAAQHGDVQGQPCCGWGGSRPQKRSLLLDDPFALAPLLIFLCRLRGEAEALERSWAVQ